MSVCHLPENFCTLSMTRSILTVPFAFLINVSSLILSWLLILPLPTHCTKVKDTVHYYTVTYMLLIWRRLNDLDPEYTVRNILFEATFFERISFFEVRVSYNIVFTTAIALTHAIGHVTLRPVLRAEWSDHGQTTGRGASWTPL